MLDEKTTDDAPRRGAKRKSVSMIFLYFVESVNAHAMGDAYICRLYGMRGR